MYTDTMTLGTSLLAPIPLALSLVLSPPTPPDPLPEPPVLDERSERVLTAWELRHHRPAEAPLLAGSFRLEVELTGRGAQQGHATYRWRRSGEAGEPESELAWDPPALGAALEREGWPKDRFDAEFLHRDARGEFLGCRLEAKDGEAGGTVIEVHGESPSGLVEMHFDAEGLLTRRVHEVEMMPGQNARFSLRPTWRETDGRLVLAEESFEMSSVFGRITSRSTFEHREVEGVLLPHRIEERSTWNGQPSGTRVFEYTEWELEHEAANGEASGAPSGDQDSRG